MFKFIAKQFRQPSGLLGRIISNKMEKNNNKVYHWVMPLIKTNDGDKILEIGYGAGTGINILASRGQNLSIYGIDFSKIMYKKAARNNRHHSEKKIHLAYGDLLTYDTEKEFGIIFGINVLYFWKDLSLYFSKIRDLLKAGGTLYLYMAGPERLDKIIFTHNTVFNKYQPDEVCQCLKKAGFKNIRYETNKTDIGSAYLIMTEK